MHGMPPHLPVTIDHLGELADHGYAAFGWLGSDVRGFETFCRLAERPPGRLPARHDN
jgi:hypothetical protein